ncbi:DDE-type integrase/transposase/recombinase [Aneurinibacillus aneurinilyticus]|uniref:DDE-type integrase/transposase/recombinase n=1 Tax=Aneurinibacillus aneurinilyticus TaxID=1391 RepID=UPI003525D5FC
MAYQISNRNDLHLVIGTIKQATKRRDVKGSIIHSDQGFQYTFCQYYNLLQKHGVVPSMSRKENCSKVCMENLFGHLESEKYILINIRQP